VVHLGHNVPEPGRYSAALGHRPDCLRRVPVPGVHVGLHVATRALSRFLIYFCGLGPIIGGFSLDPDRRIETVDHNLAWMIILASIPVGLVGVRSSTLPCCFGNPVRAAIFLNRVNGLILFRPRGKFRTVASRARRRRRSPRVRSIRARARRPGPGLPAPRSPCHHLHAGGCATLAARVTCAPPFHPVVVHSSFPACPSCIHDSSLSFPSYTLLSKIGYVEALIIGSAQILRFVGRP